MIRCSDEGVSVPDFATASGASPATSSTFEDDVTRRCCTFTLKLAADQWRDHESVPNSALPPSHAGLRIVMSRAAAAGGGEGRFALPADVSADGAAAVAAPAPVTAVAPPALLVLEALPFPSPSPGVAAAASASTAGGSAGAAAEGGVAAASAALEPPLAGSASARERESDSLSALDGASAMAVSLTVTPRLARLLLATAPAAAAPVRTAPATATGGVPLEPVMKPEFVFVLRTHPGCMQGDAHQKAVGAVQFALRCLPPGCRFGIIAYAGGLTSVMRPLVECDGSAGLVDYTNESLVEATRLLDNLSLLHRGADVLPRDEHIRNKPDQLLRAMQAATSRLSPAARRHVSVFTDGVDAGEGDAIRSVHTAAAAAHGQLHVHAFGTGAGVSKRVVAGVAEAGCGFASIVADCEPLLGHVARAIKFAHQRGMVGVAVDWGCPHDDHDGTPAWTLAEPQADADALAAAGSVSSPAAAVGGAGAPAADAPAAPAAPAAATIVPGLPCAASADTRPARLLAVLRKPTGAGSTAELLARATIRFSDYDGMSVRMPLMELPAQVLASPSPSPSRGLRVKPETATSATGGMVDSAGPVTLRALRTALHGLCAAASGEWYFDSHQLRSQQTAATGAGTVSADRAPSVLADVKARAISLSEAWQLPCALTELIGPAEEEVVRAARDRAMQPERDARARWEASEAARRAAWEAEQAPRRAEWEGTEAILRAEWEAGDEDRQKAWAEWSAAEALRVARSSGRRREALEFRQPRIEAAKARGDRLWTVSCGRGAGAPSSCR